jgi:GNAT superfamily N-acetyltransferase
MVALAPITADNLEQFKAVRLRALRDAPSAFGSTWARESHFTHAEWMSRVLRWSGDHGIGFLAIEDGVGCGIAGALLKADDASTETLELRRPRLMTASLVSMWTAPSHRQRGVGRMLVGAVLDWARLRGVQSMTLMVVSTNSTAIDFYLRLGFAMTGRTEPYPNDASLVEYEMARRI